MKKSYKEKWNTWNKLPKDGDNIITLLQNNLTKEKYLERVVFFKDTVTFISNKYVTFIKWKKAPAPKDRDKESWEDGMAWYGDGYGVRKFRCNQEDCMTYGCFSNVCDFKLD